MRSAFLRSGALMLAALLAACATRSSTDAARGGGIEVVRYHLGQPIPRTQIAIDAFDQADANHPEFRLYAAAVARQLTRLGWRVMLTTAQADQVALIDLTQGSEAIAQVAPGRIGGGAAGPATAAPDPNIVATMLDVRLKRRSDGTVVWEGRAVSQARAGTPESQRTVAVESLAAALFRDFPGESGRIIRVR